MQKYQLNQTIFTSRDPIDWFLNTFLVFPWKIPFTWSRQLLNRSCLRFNPPSSFARNLHD
jgi:hypothetical protein